MAQALKHQGTQPLHPDEFIRLWVLPDRYYCKRCDLFIQVDERLGYWLSPLCPMCESSLLPERLEVVR